MLRALVEWWIGFQIWLWAKNPLARWWGWYKYDVHPDMDAVWEPWRPQVSLLYRMARSMNDPRMGESEKAYEACRELLLRYPETTLVDRWRLKRLSFWIVHNRRATAGQAVREYRRMKGVVEGLESRIREMGS